MRALVVAWTRPPNCALLPFAPPRREGAGTSCPDIAVSRTWNGPEAQSRLKTRICYVINAFEVGGAESVALALAANLPADRYEVQVLAVKDRRHDSPMRARFREARVSTEARDFGTLSNPLNLLHLIAWLRRRRWDVIHGHNRPSDGWAAIAGRYAGVPHRLWTRHLVYRDMSDRQLKRYRRLSQSAPVVVAVSDAVRDNCVNLEGIAPEKVVTIVNGIDTGRFRPLAPARRAHVRRQLGIAAGDVFLLFVGRLNEQKAPEAFVDVVTELRRRGEPVVGLMCGDGPLREELEGRVRESAVVRLLGVRDDVPDLAASADLFVSTSRNEGLPLNIMEAMAAGAPFVGPAIEQIACLCTGKPELAAGLYAPPPGEGPIPLALIAEWANTIQARLVDSTGLADAGRAGRDVIARGYSLDAMVAAHDRIYARMMGLPAST